MSEEAEAEGEGEESEGEGEESEGEGEESEVDWEEQLEVKTNQLVSLLSHLPDGLQPEDEKVRRALQPDPKWSSHPWLLLLRAEDRPREDAARLPDPVEGGRDD